MESIRQYVISITAASIIVSCVHSVTNKSSSKDMIKLICGLFLTVTAIAPIISSRDNLTLEIPNTYAHEGSLIADSAVNYRNAQIEALTKNSIESYILEKSKELDINISVDVAIESGDIPIPYQITITGNIPTLAKQQLSEMIYKDLNIPKEFQYWIE